MNKKYNSSNTPFFTTNAIQYINDIGIKHLVVDTPTIDIPFFITIDNACKRTNLAELLLLFAETNQFNFKVWYEENE